MIQSSFLLLSKDQKPSVMEELEICLCVKETEDDEESEDEEETEDDDQETEYDDL